MSQVTKCDNCGAERQADEETGWYAVHTTEASGHLGGSLGDLCSAECVAEAARSDEADRRRFEALSDEEQEKELAAS